MKKFIWMVPLYVLLVLLMTRIIPRKAYKSPAVIELMELKELGVVLQSYARKHRGQYPDRITDLPPGSIKRVHLQFHDPTTKQAEDWIYYGGHTTDEPPETLLATSPAFGTEPKWRLVMSIDTSAKMIREIAFRSPAPLSH